MMGTDWLGLALVLAWVGVIALLVAHSRLPQSVKLLVYVALLFRIIGGVARHTVLWEYYRGIGDARAYYRRGVEYAEKFWALDFSPILNPDTWRGGRWWGAEFVQILSGFVISIIGPNMLAEFIAFSLLSFLGLVGFAIAFRRSYPDVPVNHYLRWIWLFPSLWYWPSSVGKEAIVLLGIGLSIWGFVGRGSRINWPLLGLGLFFVFGIRPQVMAVVVVSLMLAYWLSIGGRWTVTRVFQGALILGVGLGGIYMSLSHIGIEGFDLEGVEGYLADQTGSGSSGRSTIDEVGVSWTSIPLALLNIFFRPFPWEAHNIMALFSSVEIWGLWAIVWLRRRNLMRVLRNWRSDRLVCAALAFILVYSSLLGMLIVNLGILARQRVFLFPFFFLLLEAAPGAGRRLRAVYRPPPLPAKKTQPVVRSGRGVAWSPR